LKKLIIWTFVSQKEIEGTHQKKKEDEKNECVYMNFVWNYRCVLRNAFWLAKISEIFILFSTRKAEKKAKEHFFHYHLVGEKRFSFYFSAKPCHWENKHREFLKTIDSTKLKKRAWNPTYNNKKTSSRQKKKN
jgi:hypothetical protein